MSITTLSAPLYGLMHQLFQTEITSIMCVILVINKCCPFWRVCLIFHRNLLPPFFWWIYFLQMDVRKKMCQLCTEVWGNIRLLRLQKGADRPFTSLGILNCHWLSSFQSFLSPSMTPIGTKFLETFLYNSLIFFLPTTAASFWTKFSHPDGDIAFIQNV